MPPFIRAVLAVISGLVIGAAVILTIQSFSPYQPPMDVRPENSIEFSSWVKHLPTEAYLLVLLSYMVGAFVAGFVTKMIAPLEKLRIDLLSGFILLVFAVGNFLAFPHPEWLTYTACIGFLVLAWLGGLLGKRLGRRFVRIRNA